jgi:hypothetical protein
LDSRYFSGVKWDVDLEIIFIRCSTWMLRMQQLALQSLLFSPIYIMYVSTIFFLTLLLVSGKAGAFVL